MGSESQRETLAVMEWRKEIDKYSLSNETNKKDTNSHCPAADILRKRLHTAKSYNDIAFIVGEIRQTSQQLTSQLDTSVSKGQMNQQHTLKRIELLKSQISTALQPSRDIGTMLSDASFISSRISDKVNTIDVEHARVKEALRYVQNVIELKANVLGVQDAMDTRDWERAALCISKANSLPHNLVDGEFARAMVPTSELPDYPLETIAKASQSLGQLFYREFSSAAKIQDMEKVSRYFKLFPLIGQEKEGLDVYAKFICGIIITHSRTLIQDAHKSSSDYSTMFYGLALSRLFENIATIISQHTPIVEKHYGKGKMCPVIDRIQNEADSQGGLLLDTFWDERRIDKLVDDVKNYAFPYLVSSFMTASSRMLGSSSIIGGGGASRSGSPSVESNGGGGSSGGSVPRMSEDEGVDLKAVATLVNEISMMLNRWGLYKKFLSLRWVNPQEKTKPHDTTNVTTNGNTNIFHDPNIIAGQQQQHLTIPSVIGQSALTRKFTLKISPALTTLSTFVMRRSVEKAFQLDELPDLSLKYSEESPLISSVVDDIMYMLSTLCQQITATGDVPIIKDVFTNFRRILESDFVGMTQRKLRDGAPKSSQSVRATPPLRKGEKGVTLNPDEKKLRIFMIYLNNLSVASTYAEKILADLQIVEMLPFENDAEIISSMVKAWNVSFKSRCDEIINDGLQVVFSTVANSRLRVLTTQVFRDSNYMVSTNELDNEVNISSLFSYGWHNQMSEYASILSTTNYSRLINLLAISLSRILEKWVWSLEGKVNELGAISLDRDISRIIGIVSEGRYKLREKFVRVAQIVMITGFENTQEEEGIEWSLSEEERYRARKMRVDRVF